MKKIISLVLALMMVLSLATTAFAADYEYEIYQIFTGEFVDGVLTNVKWGKNGTGTAGEAVDGEILEVLEAVEASTGNEAKLAVILEYADLTGEAFDTEETTEANMSIDNLPDGYYLVKDAAGSQNGEDEYYTTYIVKVVDGTLSINRKGDVPSVEKKIDDNGLVDANEASIGDTITYQLTGTLPTNIDDYDTYYYVFNDNLSAGLTYTNTVKVTVNGVDVTKYFYKDVTVNEDGTAIKVGIVDLLALELVEGVGDITNQTQVVVTYTAELNENAVVEGDGNPNDVYLEYSNDPNNDGDGATNSPEEPGDDDEMPEPENPTGKTPVDEVVTYTTEIVIKKVDQDGNVLTGAAFKIEGEGVNVVVVTAERYVEDENGEYWKLADGTYTTTAPTEETAGEYADTTTKYALTVVVEVLGETEGVEIEAYVGEDGTVKFTGLGAGTYTITETVVPAGYNSVEPVEVTITWDAENGFTFEGTGEDTDGTYTITVVNQRGSTLPETGGMGTTLFYLFGGIMVLAAVVLLVTKKRMASAA